ncbi:helix-turn-helix transcriptional regulator [Gemella sp. GH3]|uniref:helix-turn-helix domain-containing protein n=1 Tax=unclassified Gemella TaxID=2624949 RepID=UPI0015D0B3BF|nr:MULTISPECIES: helix-turn-helix transcriptional regulator [unclassified Gemella]MBF0713235.1 helix-turn-helix transcriptional regulator [Gemella sp. GH3.1]NYS50187.1 helix-turn-helix transcriptional regulator [Gemella sp. GH3]
MQAKDSVLSNNLKKLRKQHGYSMVELANTLGLSSHGVYANWEYGRNEPNINTIISIANLYKITIDQLLGYSGDNRDVIVGDIHEEVIELINDLTIDDVKLIKDLIERFSGYSFSNKRNAQN